MAAGVGRLFDVSDIVALLIDAESKKPRKHGSDELGRCPQTPLVMTLEALVAAAFVGFLVWAAVQKWRTSPENYAATHSRRQCKMGASLPCANWGYRCGLNRHWVDSEGRNLYYVADGGMSEEDVEHITRDAEREGRLKTPERDALT